MKLCAVRMRNAILRNDLKCTVEVCIIIAFTTNIFASPAMFSFPRKDVIQFLTTGSHCYQEGHKSSECPVCSHPLNILGRPLPYAHCAQSRLVCPMSGHIMNENNPPMVLPNGYVYGENVSVVTFSTPFCLPLHFRAVCTQKN